MRVFVKGLDWTTGQATLTGAQSLLVYMIVMYKTYVGTDMIHGTTRMIIEELFGKNSTVVYM